VPPSLPAPLPLLPIPDPVPLPSLEPLPPLLPRPLPPLAIPDPVPLPSLEPLPPRLPVPLPVTPIPDARFPLEVALHPGMDPELMGPIWLEALVRPTRLPELALPPPHVLEWPPAYPTVPCPVLMRPPLLLCPPTPRIMQADAMLLWLMSIPATTARPVVVRAAALNANAMPMKVGWFIFPSPLLVARNPVPLS